MIIIFIEIVGKEEGMVVRMLGTMFVLFIVDFLYLE